MGKKESGQAVPILLVLIAAVGLIAYLLVSKTFSFRNKVFDSLFYKPFSNAFESIEGSQSARNIESDVWRADMSSFEAIKKEWDRPAFQCLEPKNNANTEFYCAEELMISKRKWDNDSNLIVSGTLFARNPLDRENTIPSKNPYFASAGLVFDQRGAKATLGQLGVLSDVNPFSDKSDIFFSKTLEGSFEKDTVLGNYQPGTWQKFKIVYTKIQDKYTIFYYLGENKEPIQKTNVSVDGNIYVALSCKSFGLNQTNPGNKALCGFNNIVVSSSKAK